MWAALHVATVVASVGWDLYIGFMTPIADCPACLATLVSAVEWVNADVIAPGSNFTVVASARDSGDLTSTLGGASELMPSADCTASATGSMIVVADLYSSRVALSARIAQLRSVPVIGYGSTSDSFSNKEQFPMFSRVVSPDVYQAASIVAAVQSFVDPLNCD